MNQQPRLQYVDVEDFPRRWRFSEPTVIWVHLEWGLIPPVPQVISPSCPRFSPPLTQHGKDIWFQWWAHAQPASQCRPVSAMIINNGRLYSVPFSGGCKPIPCSVRIASMQDSNSVIPPQVQVMTRAMSGADEEEEEEEELCEMDSGE